MLLCKHYLLFTYWIVTILRLKYGFDYEEFDKVSAEAKVPENFYLE